MLDLSATWATFPVLQTERLVLRAVTPADATDMFRIMRDPRVVRYFGSAPMTSLDEAEQRIDRIGVAWQEQNGVRWAITQREHAQLIGTCGYWRLVNAHLWAEIGYELAPEHWGRGIMTEAVGAVLHFGFTTMKLHRVEAQIHPANTGSRRVLEKLGFVQEGYFRENYYEAVEGKFTDTVVFSLLQAAWMRKTGHL